MAARFTKKDLIAIKQMDEMSLLSIMQHLHVGVLLLFRDLKIKNYNQAAKSLLIPKHNKLKGKKIDALSKELNINLPDFTKMKNNIFIETSLIRGIRKTTINWVIFEKHSNNPNDTAYVVLLNAIEELILEELIAKMPGNVYWKNKKGRYLGCNENTLKHFNVTSYKDVIDKNDYELSEEKEANKIRAIDKKAMQTNKAIIVEEVKLTHPPIHYLSHKVPLHHKNGKVMGILGISFNINDRKRMEQKLYSAKERAERAEEKLNQLLAQMNLEVTGEPISHSQSPEEYAINMRNYLENIINNMPGNVYWKDKKGKFLGCNDNTLKYFNVSSKSELIGRSDQELLDSALAESIKKIDLETLEKNKSQLVEEVRPGNPPAYFLSQKVPLHNQKGEVIGLLGISFDITEKKEMEEKLRHAEMNEKRQQERIRILQSIGSSLAHELRTPLGAIYGYSSENVEKYAKILYDGYQLAKTHHLPVGFLQPHLAELVHDSFHNIRNVTIRTNRFIDMLLAYIKSQLNPDKTVEFNKNTFEICSINNCIDSALKHYPFLTDQERSLIQWNKAKNFKFRGNILLIEHVLFNLIRNAIYYIQLTGKGEITIFNSLGKNANKLHIKDTAQGIHPDIIEHIFDDFYSTKDNGTGIGLAYTRWVMHLLGGEIHCKSQYGQYAEFILTFPLA